MSQEPLQVEEDQIVLQLRANLAQSTSELLEMATDDDSEGARALLALVNEGAAGMDRVSNFCFEMMRAFGFCAHGLAADIPEEAAKLAALVNENEGLEWAVDLYRNGLDLSELNANLISHPQRAADARARLDQWLGRAS